MAPQRKKIIFETNERKRSGDGLRTVFGDLCLVLNELVLGRIELDAALGCGRGITSAPVSGEQTVGVGWWLVVGS